ncbi:MAG TPA: hypothetical protein VLL52_03980 [Anaerolineae bacterium]|nr:hypothetical protein [Anaerolineae bacterium]
MPPNPPSKTELQQTLLDTIADLSIEQTTAVLHFAQTLANPSPPPVVRLEDLFGDFWPEDESIDEFIATVRQWRDDDLDLHQEII